MKFVLLLLFLVCSNITLAKNIFFLSYYDAYPFNINENEGLTIDLAKRLSELSKGEFEFTVVQAMRARVNQSLRENEEVIIPFVNPTWMKDKKKERYLWSPHLFYDKNVLISSVNKIIQHGDLKVGGLTFCAIKGHIYESLKHLIKEKLVIRNDFNTFKQCLNLVSKGRVDFTIMPVSIGISLSKDIGVFESLYFSKRPTFSFKRYLLINNSLMGDYEKIVKLVELLVKDSQWKFILKKYNLD